MDVGAEKNKEPRKKGSLQKNGREGRIRTGDLVLPKAHALTRLRYSPIYRTEKDVLSLSFVAMQK